MKIKNASDLKYYYYEKNPDGHFFDRENMRFAGDTMSNYGLINHGSYFELFRKKPVKFGVRKSHYFDADTLRPSTSKPV